MKLLILSFYYPPDLSAGSFRTKALIEALERAAVPGLEVDVITTMPNRYHSLTEAAEAEEDHGWLRIRRIALPEHKSGMMDQSRAFLRFAWQVRKMTGRNAGGWDAVFATSSRLMTAALGGHIARRSGLPVYLDIRDLFTDTMGDLLSKSRLRHVLPLFRWIEKRTFRTATRINVVSAGFLPYMQDRAARDDIRVFTNGIDTEFLENDFTPPADQDGPPLIVYAGNMGEGQGLHRIVPEAAKTLEGRARFRLLGDGGRKPQLAEALDAAGVTNVELLPPVPRAKLMSHYAEADILFLHLNDKAAFLKVLPSKLFEYAATGKPVLAGLAGHASSFVQDEVPGAEVFAPCDSDGMVAAFERLATHRIPVGRGAFVARYTRSTIMDQLARDVLEIAAR